MTDAPAIAVYADMLGPDLAAPMLAAQERLSDNSILVRIHEGLVLVERGGVTLQDGMTADEAAAYLAALT